MNNEEINEPDMVIAGYARLFGDLLEAEVLQQLKDNLGDSADGSWAALFIYDRDQDGVKKKWTLMSNDFAYTEMLATRAGRIELSTKLVRERFPAFQKGWVIDDDNVVTE